MEFKEPKPIYKQIADRIIEEILGNTWSDGQRIPSVREYASEIEVNPNTVARTYTLLSTQGIIYTKRGVGYFLTDNASAAAKTYLKNQFEIEEVPFLKRTIELLDIKLEDYFSK